MMRRPSGERQRQSVTNCMRPPSKVKSMGPGALEALVGGEGGVGFELEFALDVAVGPDDAQGVGRGVLAEAEVYGARR